MAKSSYDIIKNIMMTEKCTLLKDGGAKAAGSTKNQYVFRVCKCANKLEIAAAVEEIYGVTVKSVNVMNYQGKLKRMGRSPKMGRRASWKKAVVSLSEGTIGEAQDIKGA